MLGFNIQHEGIFVKCYLKFVVIFSGFATKRQKYFGVLAAMQYHESIVLSPIRAAKGAYIHRLT